MDPEVALVLGALQVLSHTIPRRLLTFGGSVESITLDEVLFVPLLVALSPVEFFGFILLSSVAGSVLVRRSALKAVFNCGQFLVAGAVGYLIHQLLAGSGPPSADVTPRMLAAAAVGSLVICALSRLAVTSMIAYVTRSDWLDTIRVPRSHVGAWFGATALGVSGAALSFTFPWGFVPSLFLVIFVQRAFSAQIKEESARTHAERLQQHTSSLRQTATRPAIESSLTTSVIELVGARAASIIEAEETPQPGALAAPMANGQQLVVAGRIGPGTWSAQEKETLTALAGVAADTLRSADLISHLRNITDSQSEAVLAIDVHGVITFANPAAVRVLGTGSVRQTVGLAVSEACCLERDDTAVDLVVLAAQRASAQDADAVLVVDRGDAPAERLDVSYSFSALTEGDEVAGAVLVMRDVSERRAFQVAMTYRAMHDELTGLPNRRSFLERLDAALGEEDENALIFMDLDRFKLVNDSFGHLVGDKLLVEMSKRLQQHTDPRGITARLSADEFAMLFVGCTDDAALTVVVESLMGALRAPYLIDANDIFVTVSLGVATTSPGQRRDDVLLAADAAAYAAKSSGGDCVRFGTPDLVSATRERMETESRLRHAIDTGGLHLQYQPIFDTKTRSMVSVEALVRWNRDGITIAPDQFVPLAEESGLIVYLGRWVIEEACRTTRRWNVEHPDRVPITVAVNLSALQLAQPRLAEEVAAVLDRTGLPAEQLTLEITETAVLANIDANLPTLKELRGIGVQLSVDDFGTGYSSLAYLRQLPVDVVKLDASFIAGLGQDPVDAQIVGAVLRLCKALGHQVVAEGVETELQRQTLAHMGSAFMQGYLLARPMDTAVFEEYWAQMYAGAPEALPAT
uniref:Diguanylate cyclase/phosphodiesterase (GGDEF & EAL domains) with PAS/PAC sensor(S) n=1 Tax=uncultured Nocardioidaceae bacterium TaxID=253824 RepID=A0A6J4M3Z3_9ACTN|nr:MAG: diguanylate cyclase/phosphodiesterase (GGDEF & EAL domains) with PAS/PAC sensor(s) [uncultured Nocardioidaceae bacterium]